MSTAVATQRPSLVNKFAEKYSIEPAKLLDTLKSTAFRQQGDKEVTNEQMAALLIVADQYNLNPFTKEIYAFPDKGGIVPVVSVDGWARIINEHPQCDGFEFFYADETITFKGKDVPIWTEVHFYRKDRSRPTKVREYWAEVAREGMQPWQSHPNRMLRHKVFIQGGRLAFGFGGIFDEDEAGRIVERDMGAVQFAEAVVQPQSKSAKTQTAAQQADADGVIDQSMPEVRQATQATPAAAQETSKPGRDQAQQADDAKPISDSVLRVLKTKMENAGVSETDIKKKFGFDLDGVTTANYGDVVEWLKDPTQ